MCVIILKQANVAAPSDAILNTCWKNNPDGAGIAIMGKNSVTIEKGFMDYASYHDFVSALVRPEDIACYHFRIATSGGINPQACHPFPVSNKVTDLRALHVKTDRAFIHNGVISSGSKDLSDTQLYIKDILSKYISKGLDSKERQARIASETKGSRTVLMDGLTHEVFTTGDWITDKETGLLFSNTSYKPRSWMYDDWAEWDKPSLYDDTDCFFCPDCNCSCDFISLHWDLYECPECHTVYDGNGNIIIAGDQYEY